VEGFFPLSSKEEIVSRWEHFGWEDPLSKVLGKAVKLVEDKIECPKNSRKKTSIRKLVITDGIESGCSPNI
jgi:hypothetical protein